MKVTEIIKSIFKKNIFILFTGVRKELNVKTLSDAIDKWYELKPEIYIEKSIDFKTKLLILLAKF